MKHMALGCEIAQYILIVLTGALENGTLPS